MVDTPTAAPLPERAGLAERTRAAGATGPRPGAAVRPGVPALQPVADEERTGRGRAAAASGQPRRSGVGQAGR